MEEQLLPYPAGFRFVPTEDELVFYYLHRKVQGEPLPTGVIREESNLYSDKNPWEIFDKTSTEYFYVFTRLVKKSKHKFDRRAGSGTWHGQGINKSVFDDRRNLLWLKIDFVFKLDKNKKVDDHGHWLMTEFSLPDEGDENHVLCRIWNKHPKIDNRAARIIGEKRKLLASESGFQNQIQNNSEHNNPESTNNEETTMEQPQSKKTKLTGAEYNPYMIPSPEVNFNVPSDSNIADDYQGTFQPSAEIYSQMMIPSCQIQQQNDINFENPRDGYEDSFIPPEETTMEINMISDPEICINPLSDSNIPENYQASFLPEAEEDYPTSVVQNNINFEDGRHNFEDCFVLPEETTTQSDKSNLKATDNTDIAAGIIRNLVPSNDNNSSLGFGDNSHIMSDTENATYPMIASPEIRFDLLDHPNMTANCESSVFMNATNIEDENNFDNSGKSSFEFIDTLGVDNFDNFLPSLDDGIEFYELDTDHFPMPEYGELGNLFFSA